MESSGKLIYHVRAQLFFKLFQELLDRGKVCGHMQKKVQICQNEFVESQRSDTDALISNAIF